MEKDIKLKNTLSRLACVDIYISGGNGRFYWPNRLQKAKKDQCTPGVREASQQYMMDSGFEGGGVPMEQLINMAEKRQPTYIIPNDTVNTPDVAMRTAIEETAEKVDRFLTAITETQFSPTVLIPLQPPHDFHYAYLHEHYPEQVHRGHFALGGMRDMNPEDQLRHLKQFRDVAGDNAYVHGFGLGASRDMILALRDNPSLLDSVDFSTPQQNAMNGDVSGRSRKPVHFGTVKGDQLATTTSQLISAELCNIARMLAPSLTDREDLAINWDNQVEMYRRIESSLDAEGLLRRSGVLIENPEPGVTQTGIESFDTSVSE